jgi:hypothetical protein
MWGGGGIDGEKGEGLGKVEFVRGQAGWRQIKELCVSAKADSKRSKDNV